VKNLTRRQSEILDFIKSQIEGRGLPPTRREIAARFGFRSVHASSCHLAALQRKGAIRIDPNTSRTIRVIGRRSVGRGISARGPQFVFIEPARDRATGESYFPPTPIIYVPEAS